MHLSPVGGCAEPVASCARDVGSWAGDLRGEQIWWSEECYRLLGLEPSSRKVSVRALLQRVHRDDRQRVRETISRVFNEPGFYEVEYRVLMPRGEVRHFVTHGFTFCDDLGKPVSVGGTMRSLGREAIAGLTRRQADCLRVMVSEARDGIAVVDPQFGLRHWNRKILEWLGIPPELAHEGARLELLLLPLAARGDFGAGDPATTVRSFLERLSAHGIAHIRSAESGRLLELRAAPFDEGGLVLFCADLTSHDEQREKLLLADTVIANNTAGIVIADRDQCIRSLNPAFSEMTGFDLLAVVGQRVVDLFDDNSRASISGALRSLSHRSSWNGEITLCARNDEPINARATVIRVLDAETERVSHHVWLFSDISESKRVAEQVHHLANHDTLTGLPNRMALYMRLNQALPEARRRGWSVALMFIDLDRFKIINDTLGHSIGDEMLREVACRLAASIRETDLVARLGGDEFVVLLPDVNNAGDAAMVAGKILATFASPIIVNGVELHTSPSIGISLFPTDGNDGDTLLRNADTAMYCAKAAGRNNYQFYAAEMNLAATQRLELESKMRQALVRNEFALAYQPQICARRNCPVGVEALIRWHHPSDGVISPARFIPVAEETGLIVPLGEWVLRTACQEMKRWIDAGMPPMKVAVNVSARQLRRRDFLETVAGVLAETDLPPEMLELEVTESVAMDNPEESIRLLESLRHMGVSIAIDDFGTGYSSLAYLKRLPIDYLKIDRSFVADIEQDLNDRAIAFGTIALAHSLGLEVIAEGVETADQLDLLRSNGCDEIQGYFFSPPLQPAAAFSLLKELFLAAESGNLAQ